MSEKLPLAIVGCGGMGHRHLYGLAELHRAGLSQFELVGVCDPNEENARSLADQAEDLLDRHPHVVTDLDALTRSCEPLAVDVCTLPAVHHTVCIDALERGWHVMCEKPVGLTARACKLLRDAVRASGHVLSVAENYRRDPINRLAKALLDADIIGQPRLMIHQTLGGADRMLISVWRHQKNASGVLLDVGVHFADMMEYLLGEAVSVYAQTRLHERSRTNPVAGGKGASTSAATGVYERWQKHMPAEFEATAEDAAYGTILFQNGAVAQFIEDHAAHGEGIWKRAIYGSLGSMDLPGDRSGREMRIVLDDGSPIEGQALLDRVPEFHLDEVTATLFGGSRLYRYELPFTETDRKLIAVEYHELGACILQNRSPEVDIEQGARSVALSYSLMESQCAGQTVSVDDVLQDRINAYQEEINQSLRI